MNGEQGSYLGALGSWIDGQWRRFWFTPANIPAWDRLRLVVGIFSVYYFLTFTSDLTTWFASDGLLPRATVSQFVTGFGQESSFRFSVFQLDDHPVFLWCVHACFIANAMLLAFGVATPVVAALNVIAVLSYVHRGPMLTGPLEGVLTMLAIYVALGAVAVPWRDVPWRRSAERAARRSMTANLSLRLTQVHLSALSLMTGLEMLAGEPWWTGDSVWWLMARTDTRLLDLTPLFAGEGGRYLFNLLTHGMVAFHLIFAVLVWNRWLRPLVLMIAIPFWLFVGLVASQPAYALLMAAANVAFCMEPDWRACLHVAGQPAESSR